MPLFYLSVGSNCNGRRANVERALSRLKSMTDDCVCSSVYETPDLHGRPVLYMNAVVRCVSELETERLDEIAKKIELEFGRDSEARLRGEVPLDIDVVICDGEILRTRDYNAGFFQIGYQELASV